MTDSRTYTRLVCDKLLNKNNISLFIKAVVNLYYTIFTHPLNSLKFRGNFPIRTTKENETTLFQNKNSKSNILG